MYAYIDESGNTGVNLFDTEQPYFFNVAMTSQVNFDDVFRQRVEHIAQLVSAEYLHANEIGQQRVELIAPSLMELIEFSQVRFHFTLVEKPTAAVMKFYDAIFDPGENPAAPRFWYNVRLLRFLLLMEFVSILTRDDAELFWKVMARTRSKSTEDEAASIIDTLLLRANSLSDERAKTLVVDTLFWARDNITELSFWSWDKNGIYGQLPNIFTLVALFDKISRDSQDWSAESVEIIHDQQKQFENTLKDWHSLFKGIEPTGVFHFGDTPIELPDIRNSTFKTLDSKSSPGLQVVDTVLWIFSRYVSEKQLGPNSLQLLDICVNPNDTYIMSFDSLATEVEQAVRNLMSLPLEEEAIRKAEQQVEHDEQVRKQLIKEGISPLLKLG